jgi:RNA polymerase sigma factor (sigma-70 family)
MEPRPHTPANAPTLQERRQRLVEVLVAAGEEDRAAFRELYRLTSAKLFGITLRICGDRQAAEDVLHDVYLTIWKRAGAYEPSRASPITWLATIARNRAIDWRRAQTIRRTTPLDDTQPIVDTRPSALEALSADQDAHLLHDCLDTLEDRQRESIRTAFFDGLTYAQLAERQNTPLGTVKSWVRRGLMKLRECLEQ